MLRAICCTWGFALTVGAQEPPPPAVRAERAVKLMEIPDRRGGAMMELWSLGSDAVPALVRALRDPRDQVVESACAVLHELGPHGAEARIHLERQLEVAKGARARALKWAQHGITAEGFVLAEWNSQQLTLLDDKGAAIGKVGGLGNPWDVQTLPGERYLVTDVGKNKVCEVDAKGDVLWEVDGLNSPNRARRIWNGNTLVADFNNQRVVEFDPAGKIVWERKELQPSYVQRLLDGTTLVVDLKSDKLLEIDPTGKIVASLEIPDQVYWAQRLPGGNTLVADRNGGRVYELDEKGEQVAELTGLSSPNACLRLADGTTVVAGAKGVVAFDRDGKRLWQRPGQWVGGLSR